MYHNVVFEAHCCANEILLKSYLCPSTARLTCSGVEQLANSTPPVPDSLATCICHFTSPSASSHAATFCTLLVLPSTLTYFLFNVTQSTKMTGTTEEADAAAARASEQARIRRERREAKIRAGGASRLNKITGLGGGLQRGMFYVS